MKGVLGHNSVPGKLAFVQANPMAHVGMEVAVRGGPNDEQEIHVVTQLLPETNEAVMDEDFSFDPAGLEFIVRARVPSVDVRAWEQVDVLDFLHFQKTEIEEMEFEKMDDMRCLIGSEVVTLTEESTRAEIDSAWTEKRRWLECIRTRSRELGVTGRESEDQLNRSREMNTIIHVYACAYETLYGSRFLDVTKRGTEGNDLASEFRVNPWWLSVDPSKTKTTDDLELIEFFLAQAFRQNVRKSDEGIVYSERLQKLHVPKPSLAQPECAHPQCHRRAVWGDAGVHKDACENNANMERLGDRRDLFCDQHKGEAMVDVRYTLGDVPALLFGCGEMREVGTKSWEPCKNHASRMQTLEEWMNKVLDRTVHYDLWAKFVSNYTAHLKNCGKYLRDTYDSSLKWVTRDPMWYSYRNGLYNIKTNEFVAYGSADSSALHQVCSANFVDTDFLPAWTSMPVEDLDVPGYDEIIQCQGYSPEMRMWLDTFFGRLFFPINAMDKWEKLMIITGWAATGKSTIAKAIAHLIGEVNVGYIASNCEEQWALASVYSKSIWMCLELKAGFRLPTGVMQSMVSGETVVINEKFKTAFALVWSLQGLLVGNELPTAWSTDVAGALARRVLPFPFEVAPAHQDSSIATRLMQNMGKMLVRITRQYNETVSVHGDMDINSILPTELKEAMEDFRKKSAPIMQFLDDNSTFTKAPEELRKLIQWELIVGQGLNPKTFGMSKQDVKILQDHYDTMFVYNKQTKTWHPRPGVPFKGHNGLDEDRTGVIPGQRPITQLLLDEWSVSKSDMELKFKDHCSSSSVDRNVKLDKEEYYKAPCRNLRIPYVKGQVVGSKGTIKSAWFGLRLNSMGGDDD